MRSVVIGAQLEIKILWQYCRIVECVNERIVQTILIRCIVWIAYDGNKLIGI